MEYGVSIITNPSAIPKFVKLTSYERDIMRMQTKQGFAWLWEMGLWQAWGKRHYQVSRRGFYCCFVKECNRTGIPELPDGAEPLSILGRLPL